MRDQVWWLLIGITLLAVVFDRLLALWDRRRVQRKLLRTLMEPRRRHLHQALASQRGRQRKLISCTERVDRADWAGPNLTGETSCSI